MARTTWLRGLLLGITALVLTVAGCSGGGDQSPAPTPTSPPASQPTFVNGTTAPDGGSVRVTGQGVSQITDGRGGAMVSFGVMVENTSTNWVATGTKLTVTFAKDSGAPVEDQIEHGQYSAHATFPQQRTGIGAAIYVSSPGTTRIAVQIGASIWYPRSNAAFAEVTTADVATRRGTRFTTVTFAMTSAYHQTLGYLFLYFIFRDQAGQLIGGAGGGGEGYPCSSVPPGTSKCTSYLYSPFPAGTVDARTEVYVNGI